MLRVSPPSIGDIGVGRKASCGALGGSFLTASAMVSHGPDDAVDHWRLVTSYNCYSYVDSVYF